MSYVDSFSFEWERHPATQFHLAEAEPIFRQKTGWGPEDVRGLTVLDAGCGTGRFARLCEHWGARVVGMDLSTAVWRAQENMNGYPAAFVQGGIMRTPFRPAAFDRIFSIGVLHHTPDPEAGFRALVPLLKSGGRLAVWVYGPMGRWVWVSDQYRRVTVHLPHWILYGLCTVAAPLGWLYRQRWFPSTLAGLLPVSQHPRAAVRILDTFDWYSPRYQAKQTVSDVVRWFQDAGLTEIEALDFPVAVRGRKP